MSFLELSLSYVYEKPKSRAGKALLQAERAVALADALPYARKKAILKVNLAVLILFAVFYVYLSGAIVSENAEKISKTKDFETVSRELDSMRARLLSADAGFSMRFFEAQGYHETKDLNVIKRTNNVASKEEFNTYQ